MAPKELINTSSLFAYMSNPAPDSSLCTAAAPRLRPLQLLLPVCVCFSCCSPIASTLTAPRLHPLRLLLPSYVRFNCCSPTSTAAPRLHASACSPSWIPAHAQAQCTFFAEFEVQNSFTRTSHVWRNMEGLSILMLPWEGFNLNVEL